MPRAIWSGAISFGLVNIPIKLFNAVSRKSVHFNQIDTRTGARIQYRKVSAADGEEVPAELAGWQDTIYVPPDTTIRIIARFEDHADPTTPYMYHCHVLRHEDQGMMAQFVVVEPGDEPDLGGTDGMAGHDH